jgi:F5/8 type C domain
VVDAGTPAAVPRKVQRRSSALSVAAARRGLVTVGMGFLLLGVGFLALGVFLEMGQEPDRALLAARAAKLNSIPTVPAAPGTTAAARRAATGKPVVATASASASATPTAMPTAGSSLGPTTGTAPPGSPRPSEPGNSEAPVAPPDLNLALNRQVTASSQGENFEASDVTDGAVSSYWESDPGFPQTLTVDLGSVTAVGRLGLALPTCCNWSSRTQTIAVYGSLDGMNFSPIADSAGYTFDADGPGGDAVSVPLPATAVRFVQLRFTGNSGWSAAQLGELQVHSS